MAPTSYITALRFPLALLVVLIPTQSKIWQAAEAQDSLWFSVPVHFLSRSLPAVAVPLFFAISGFLFFYQKQTFTLADQREKLRKRCVTLLLPYVVWNLLAFLMTPLKLANPTELLSRTNPTIYDVIIALFGGAAGLLEISRKEKGTVLSGVAIATALMPPLCTAGYGLASGHISYFFGALMLFIINGVFIIIATYLMSKILGFPEYEFLDAKQARRTRSLVTLVFVLVTIPSILSAITMIRSNKFAQNAERFVSENKMLDSGYIYDYDIDTHKGGKISLYIAGNMLDENEKSRLRLSAKDHGIDPERVEFYAHQIAPNENGSADKLVRDIYARTDSEIGKRDAQIRMLEMELSKYKQKEIPYTQISREIVSQYPQVEEIYISRGADVTTDSLYTKDCILVVAKTQRALGDEAKLRMTEFLKARLNDTTVVVINALDKK